MTGRSRPPSRVAVGQGLSVRMVLDARRRIAPHVPETALLRSHALSALTGGDVYLKLECHQLLRSFKIRGVANRVLRLGPADVARGIAVSSSGNHGAAAAYCGQRWGVSVDVYVPGDTARSKLELIRRHGARVHLVGGSFDEANAAFRERVETGGAPLAVDAVSDPLVVAGHGTIALEILEREPLLDDVVVPVGGGGLVTGIGVAVRALAPGARVIGVQTEACPALAASLRDGRLHEEYPAGESACDALVGGVGRLPYEMAPRVIDTCDVVSERSILGATRFLLEEERVVAEPSGAVGVAWIMEHAPALGGRRVAAIVSGGNVDISGADLGGFPGG